MRLTSNKIRRTSSNVVKALLIAVLALCGINQAHAADKNPKMTKQERVCLRNGNKLYEK